MKYNKLNKNWNADPNSPMPEVSACDGDIKLSFYLNSFVYDHIDEGEKGIIEFYNVYAYRLGSTNDEGYFHGQFRYKNNQLPWGEFYELADSHWDKDFPDDKIILNDSIDKKGLRHFIFFFKDETFECIATDYSFSYQNSISDMLDEKYPKGYLSHYLVMFTSNFDTPSVYNYETYNDLYIQMEGKEEFKGVRSEIKVIKSNNDMDLFLKFVNQREIENFGKERLNEMIKIIEKYKIDK